MGLGGWRGKMRREVRREENRSSSSQAVRLVSVLMGTQTYPHLLYIGIHAERLIPWEMLRCTILVSEILSS